MGSKLFRTYKSAASACGISASYFCNIVHERKIPRYHVAERIANATGIDIRAWLIPEKYFNPYIASTLGTAYSFNIKKSMKEQGFDIVESKSKYRAIENLY